MGTNGRKRAWLTGLLAIGIGRAAVPDPMPLYHVDEYLSRTSYTYSDSTSKHVVALTFPTMDGEVDWSAGGLDYKRVDTYGLAVPSGTGSGVYPGGMGGSVTTGSYKFRTGDSAINCVKAGMSAPTEVHAYFSGASASTNVTVLYSKTSVQSHWNGSAWVNDSSSLTYWREDYAVTKIAPNTVAIDSRKAFGVPNIKGELPGDGNAPARPIHFEPWSWKGGVFVGNLYPAVDRSGTARTEFVYSLGSPSNYMGSCLALFYKGHADDAASSADIGLYVPGSSDANIGTAFADITWATKWDIQPGASHDPPNDYSKDPWDQVSFSSTTGTDDYKSWQLFKPGVTPPTTLSTKCALCLNDESSLVNYGTASWWYFASSLFKGDASTAPDNDSEPRIWCVSMAATEGVTQ